MNIIEIIPILFLIIVLIIAAIYDYRFNRIPNWLTFPTMIGAVTYHTVIKGFEGLIFGLEGIGIGVAALIVFYLIGWMGAGDIKLLGAVGGFLGPKGVFIAFLFTAIVGGIYALLLLTITGYFKETVNRYKTILLTFLITKRFFNIPFPKRKTNHRLCYGVAIALGTSISICLRGI